VVAQEVMHGTAVDFEIEEKGPGSIFHKFARPLGPQQAQRYLNEVLEPLCGVFAGIDLYRKALALQERWRYSFYDCLIIASALQAGCRTLYSEDLQHRQSIETLTIVDPFR
jgi:predicted nucleic acid-binding protein